MRFCCVAGCEYPVFGTDKHTGFGYCKNHQRLRTDQDRRSIVQKAMSKRVQGKVRGFMKNSQEPNIVDEQLQYWYEGVAKVIASNPYCWECGTFIPQSFYRAASAHILPKRKEYGCPSVKTHPDNYLVLGANCGCHGKYDTSFLDASEMKIWGLAVERFKKIFPHIAPEELKNVPEILLKTVNHHHPS